MRSKRALSSRLLICLSSSRLLIAHPKRYVSPLSVLAHPREIGPFLSRTESTLDRLQQAGQESEVHSLNRLVTPFFATNKSSRIDRELLSPFGHQSLLLAFCLAARRCMNLGLSFL